MTTIKSYSDLQQSKKLAKILPLESADMWWAWYSSPLSNGHYGDFPMFSKPVCNLDESIPCWSLAALSEFILPYITDDDGNNYKFYLSKDGLDRWIAYYKCDDTSIHICEESDNMIDVIFEMVCWLKVLHV